LVDFVKQVPVWILIAPVLLAIVYGVMMFVIFRRARQRRRNRGVPTIDPSQLATSFGNYGSGALPLASSPFSSNSPALSAATQPHAIPARFAQITGNSLPEPDFDSLMPPIVPPPSTPSPVSNTPLSNTSLDRAPLPLPDFSSERRAVAAPVTGSPIGDLAADAGDAVEVMRILRDLSNGKLIIEIGCYQDPAPTEIPNSELARRFQSVVRELNGMLTPPSSTALRRPTVEGTAMPNIKLPSQPPPPPIESPMSLRRTVGMTAAPQETLNRGIADEIENYLQYKLANTPDFQHRSIHIRPTADGGVQIEVENQIFQAMDLVSDPEVRAFLMTTMREWEARQ